MVGRLDQPFIPVALPFLEWSKLGERQDWLVFLRAVLDCKTLLIPFPDLSSPSFYFSMGFGRYTDKQWLGVNCKVAGIRDVFVLPSITDLVQGWEAMTILFYLQVENGNICQAKPGFHLSYKQRAALNGSSGNNQEHFLSSNHRTVYNCTYNGQS